MYVFPTDKYNANDAVLLTVPKADIPFFRRLWQILQDRETWFNRESWFRGYQEAAWLEEMLMTNTLADLVEGQNRIYRLLDTVMNGTSYTAIPDPANPGDFLVSPAIPPAPPLAITPPALGQDPGLRRQLLDAQGIINAGWFGIGGKKATLADVVEALRIGSPSDAARIDSALDALAAASNAATVFDVVRGLLTDTVDVGLEGATLGTLIAASIANAATQGILSSQLDRIIAALDGGGLAAPPDSVLERLRTVDQNIADIETML